MFKKNSNILIILMVVFGIYYLLVYPAFHRKVLPSATKGILDLRNWDFKTKGAVILSGDWEFYAYRFLNSHQFDTVQSKTYQRLPGNWKGKIWQSTPIGDNSWASLRLKILMPRYNGKCKLRIERILSAYQCFADDSLIASAGTTGTSKLTSIPEYKLNYPDISISRDTTTIVLWVSNFSYRRTGAGTILLADSQTIIEDALIKTISDSVLIGMQITFAFILFSLYFYRRKEILNLLFGLVCVMMILRMLVTQEMILKRIIPGLPFELSVKFELLPLILSVALHLYFIHVFYNYRVSKIILWLITIISIVVSAIILGWNASINSYTVHFMQYVAMMALFTSLCYTTYFLNKVEDASLMLLGTIFLIISSTSEIMALNNLGSYTIPLPIGILIFYFSQIIIISKRMSVAFTRVENFAGELEITVKERTLELEKEKEKTEFLLKRSDSLLINVLPEPIAERLKDGEAPIADFFEEASVVFVDIVNFTDTSSRFSPRDVVHMLNEIFTIFDKVSAKYGLEKIKTIGDCYMAAAGIPQPREDHARAALQWALEVNEITRKFSYQPKEASSPKEPVKIQFRTGLNCGSIVAGVIGEQKFIYDLWGDMVNSASRMESNSMAGKIQCTDEFKKEIELKNQGIQLTFIDRGEIEIKGKGKMRTWFVESPLLSS